jgi:PAS domain S-box-containing protein
MKNTTRRKKERRLLDLVKIAADQCGDGIIITNASFDYNNPKILYANQEFCDMTGYILEEIIGKNTRLLQGPKTDLIILARLRMTLSAGKSFHGRTINYRKDGSEFYIEWDIAPIFNSEEKVTHFISIIRDITDEVSAKNSKDELVNVVSNELKSPLLSIKGFVDMLKYNLNERSEEKNNEYLAIITGEIDRLLRLADELLDTTETKIVGVQPDKKLCDLDDIVRQVIKNIKSTYSSHKIKRRGKIGSLVNCDKSRIRKVVTNLLTFAIKASPDGEHVCLNIEKENDQAVIRVQDFGQGIPDEQQETLFEQTFSPSHNTKSVNSDMELYIAADIVRNHDGKIWVESTEGKGSIFSFSLPLL